MLSASEQPAPASGISTVRDGERIFAVEIHNQHSELAKVDWRKQYADLYYQVHHLPEDVQGKIRRLMKAFRLTYSAIDMAVLRTGEYVFFEINPNGQFAFCQEATGLPLFPTLASLLASAGSRRMRTSTCKKGTAEKRK